MSRYSENRLDISLQTDRPSYVKELRSGSQDRSMEQAKEANSKAIVYSTIIREKEDLRSKFMKDKYLNQLSKRNDQLRQQLRLISDELSTRIDKKRVKKKVPSSTEHRDEHLKNQLRNAYNQIEHCKKVLARLKVEDSGELAQHKLDDLENTIKYRSDEIETSKEEIRSLSNVKHMQDKELQLGVDNVQLKATVDDYRRELDQLKAKLRQMSFKDRQQEIEYKKQQAYQIELQTKFRQLNNDFHPSIKKPDQPLIEPTEISEQEWAILKRQKQLLKKEHDEYFKNIDAQLMNVRKVQDQTKKLNALIKEKEKRIQTLRGKNQVLRKLGKEKKQEVMQDYYPEPEPQPEPEIPSPIGSIDHLKANLPEPIPHFSLLNPKEEKPPELKKWDNKFKTDDRGMLREGAMKFSDEDTAPNGSRVIGATVWVFKGVVSALTMTYQKDGRQFKGALTYPGGPANAVGFDLPPGDFLKNFGGAVNSENGLVEYLVMVSKQGKIGRFGTLNSKLKQFNFAIGESEVVDAIYGATCMVQGDQRLCLLGCRISVDPLRKLG